MSNKASKLLNGLKAHRTVNIGSFQAALFAGCTVRFRDQPFECGQRDGISRGSIIYRIQDGPVAMIRKLKSGEYRLYSRKKNAKTGKRRNLGTFSSLSKAREHERAVQFFKRH